MDQLKDSDLYFLRNAISISIEKNVNLSSITKWRTGGRARVIFKPNNLFQLCFLKKYLAGKKIHHITIGHTSNLLFSDQGLDVPCIKITPKFGKIKINNTEVFVEAGASAPWVARKAMQHSLTGIEHICGIPGTIGGLVYMNGGSSRKSISDFIKSVESVNDNGEIISRTSKDCLFSYRDSIYQKNKETITAITLDLTRSKKDSIRKKMLDSLRSRRKKFPLKTYNCGSTFKSNKDLYEKFGPPGLIIENLGLKGLREGDAEVSLMHANFIINSGKAKSLDIIKLIYRVNETIFQHTGKYLETEPIFVTKQGNLIKIEKALDVESSRA